MNALWDREQNGGLACWLAVGTAVLYRMLASVGIGADIPMVCVCVRVCVHVRGHACVCVRVCTCDESNHAANSYAPFLAYHRSLMHAE